MRISDWSSDLCSSDLSQFNQNTAVQQQLLNMTNQVNPWGSVTYSHNGSTSFVGADGKTYSVPRLTQTTTFTPEQQAIFDSSQEAEGNPANLAADHSEFLQGYPAKPIEINNKDAGQWAYASATPRFRERQGQPA